MMVLVWYMKVKLFIHFSFSIGSVINTGLIFCAVFLLSSIIIYFNVYKSTLLNLFKRKIVAEKELKGSYILGLFALVLLIVGYSGGILSTDKPTMFLLGVLLAFSCSVIGTFLFFGHFMAKALNHLVNNNKSIYKGGRIIWIRQLTHRIRTSSKVLSIITLLVASTLTAVGVSNGMDMQVSNITEKMRTYDIQYITDKEDIVAQFDHALINTINPIKNIEKYHVKTDFKDEKLYFISDKEMEDLDVLDNQAVLYNSIPNIQRPIGSIIEKTGYTVIVKQVVDHPFLNEYPTRTTLIIDDQLYQSLPLGERITQAVVFENRYEAFEDIQKLALIVKDEYHFTILQATELYTFKMITFISVLIGMIFIFSSGSILYVKVVGTVVDDKESFLTLSKIGFSKRQIKGFISKFTGTVFFLPMILGSVHGAVAVYMLKLLLELNSSQFFYKDITYSSFGVFGLFYFFYYLFYRITVFKAHTEVLKDI